MLEPDDNNRIEEHEITESMSSAAACARFLDEWRRGRRRRRRIRLAARQRKPVKSPTGFRGVSRLVIATGVVRFKAKIQAAGKGEYLGTYDTPEQAARAFDARSRELYGKDAPANFPISQPFSFTNVIG